MNISKRITMKLGLTNAWILLICISPRPSANPAPLQPSSSRVCPAVKVLRLRGANQFSDLDGLSISRHSSVSDCDSQIGQKDGCVVNSSSDSSLSKKSHEADASERSGDSDEEYSTKPPVISSRSDDDSASCIGNEEVGDLVQDAMSKLEMNVSNAAELCKSEFIRGYSNRTKEYSPISNQPLICLSKDGPVLKQLLSLGVMQSNETLQYGDEAFFHFQILCRDRLIADSRVRNGTLLPPARIIFAGRPHEINENSSDPPTPSQPQGTEADMLVEVWDLALGSMRRGESSLFFIHGPERIAQLLARPFVHVAQNQLPSGAAVRVAIELQSFGLVDLDGDGGAVYHCEQAGSGYATPRPADEVLVSYAGCLDGVEVANSRGWRWTQLGVGLLPLGLEMAIFRFPCHLPVPPPCGLLYLTRNTQSWRWRE